jgi:uncharacterized OB-fold protein
MTTTATNTWFGAHTADPPSEPGGVPALFAGRCPSGHHVFPYQDMCPHDWEPLERFKLSDHGTIHSYTVIHTAPKNFVVPYAVAYVDMPERVRCFAQIVVDDPSTLHIGQKVALTSGVIRTDAAGPVHGYKFRVEEKA